MLSNFIFKIKASIQQGLDAFRFFGVVDVDPNYNDIIFDENSPSNLFII
jgi:hypothetical protein